MPREFTEDGDHYSLSISDLGLSLHIDRLRRERHELIGELSVYCTLPGACVVNGNHSLSIADLNLSSARCRAERARLLQTRANIPKLDWAGVLEEFSQRVIEAERRGEPAVDLRQVPAQPVDNLTYSILGLDCPKNHPTVLFGDGGTCKSYLALYLAGKIAEHGQSVAVFDWELSAEDHRTRLEKLFPDGMPRVFYVYCSRPLVHEVDRLRRIVRDNEISYAVYDSVAFAADGPPEAAETAGKYFRAARQIGCGSLHIAHISKGLDADKKPFGSTFWHNCARATWFIKTSDESADNLHVGLFPRKSNLQRLPNPVGLRFQFDQTETSIRRMEVASSPELAQQLSVRQRMEYLLKPGAMSVDGIAAQLEAKPDTISRTVRRYRNRFVIIDGGRIGLRSDANA